MAPSRPGEECRGSPGGVFAPRIKRSKCEGESDCLEVCPHDLFEVRRTHAADFAALGPLAKLKSEGHERQIADTLAKSSERTADIAWWRVWKTIKLVKR